MFMIMIMINILPRHVNVKVIEIGHVFLQKSVYRHQIRQTRDGTDNNGTIQQPVTRLEHSETAYLRERLVTASCEYRQSGVVLRVSIEASVKRNSCICELGHD